MKKKIIIGLLFCTFLVGCGESNEPNTINSNVVENNSTLEEDHDDVIEDNTIQEVRDESSEENSEGNVKGDESMKVSAILPVKNPMEHNPVMTQSYSADPYAVVYDGRVYLYLTGDKVMYEADGSVKKNDYSNINTIHVISSDDLVNWTDHGEILAAGKNGAANWGNNSWAPAACWKEIDGKPKFFLYFANSGNGIAVLTSDSPTGPFVDPLGEAIVSRKTPTCDAVTWLFDPAVLIDDDGCGYLYFGGGVPNKDMVSNPGTARVAKLADDMIHLESDPVPIENVQYLFEDSGINKVEDKYIYSYCSNFDVPDSFKAENGFGTGEIITMVGDSPMGPFETVGSILKNPEFFFKYGGNNHHCMFEFEGKWYVTYHANLIAEKLGSNDGYRSVNVDEIEISEDGLFMPAKGTKEGVKQVKSFNPYVETTFTTMSNQAGISLADEDNTKLRVDENGAFTQITGADFDKGASKCIVTIKAPVQGSVSVRTNLLNSEDIGKLYFDNNDSFETFEIALDSPVSGICDIYFVYEGEGLELDTFIFE